MGSASTYAVPTPISAATAPPTEPKIAMMSMAVQSDFWKLRSALRISSRSACGSSSTCLALAKTLCLAGRAIVRRGACFKTVGGRERAHGCRRCIAVQAELCRIHYAKVDLCE